MEDIQETPGVSEAVLFFSGGSIDQAWDTGQPQNPGVSEERAGSDHHLEYCSSFKLEHFKLVDKLKDLHDKTCTPPSCSVTASMFNGHLKISCRNHDPYTLSPPAPTIQTWSKKNLHRHSTSEEFPSC